MLPNRLARFDYSSHGGRRIRGEAADQSCSHCCLRHPSCCQLGDPPCPVGNCCRDETPARVVEEGVLMGPLNRFAQTVDKVIDQTVVIRNSFSCTSPKLRSPASQATSSSLPPASAHNRSPTALISSHRSSNPRCSLRCCSRAGPDKCLARSADLNAWSEADTSAPPRRTEMGPAISRRSSAVMFRRLRTTKSTAAVGLTSSTASPYSSAVFVISVSLERSKLPGPTATLVSGLHRSAGPLALPACSAALRRPLRPPPPTWPGH